MIYEFHTFSMNLFLMFEFNCVAEEREAGAPHSSAARAQLQAVMLINVNHKVIVVKLYIAFCHDTFKCVHLLSIFIIFLSYP